ncbi:replication protein [Lactiplantibacillus plantarum]|uniref:replication protein n=1 Tax=Lactiplantibacillus plantarum TaxID=1590 RepID=UPI001FB323BA|nr:replication protein [Lactiplantibacillus plantarum]UOC10277.1 replication protein [Lactiplantibacillus plantarum]
MAKDKSRYFTFLLYPESIPEDWKSKLELIGVPIAVSPLHDKDKSTVSGQEFKKPHYHVVYVAKNPVTADSVRYKIKQLLGDQSIAKVQIVIRSMTSMYLYLTHESKDAIEKKKHKYNKQDITLINNFDIDRYISLDVEDKDDMLNDVCDLIDDHNLANMRELRRFLKAHGSEYGMPSIKIVNSVLRAHTGLIRLYFDAVYQERKYGRDDINKETGEILENKEIGNE